MQARFIAPTIAAAVATVMNIFVIRGNADNPIMFGWGIANFPGYLGGMVVSQNPHSPNLAVYFVISTIQWVGLTILLSKLFRRSRRHES